VQRDAAFAKHLKSRLPILMGRRIDSLAKAESAVDEIRAIDLFTLPIGIPFNQLSEDIANGKPHATIADWLPDTPVSPGYAVQDAYLASPTRENLVRLTTYPNQASGSAEILSRLKYQSLMRYVHFLKTSQRILTKGENPFCQIGEFGKDVAVAHGRSAETAQRLAVQGVDLSHEVGLLDDPLEELGDHLFSGAILADDEGVSPLARAADVDVELILLGMNDRGIDRHFRDPRDRN
jgi:hypothetical protein